MKVVIDIPEEMYSSIMQGYVPLGISKHLLNGTPLPKGHGRLIDADSMKTIKNIQSANFNAVDLIRLWIDKQNTIIEADTESEET